MEKQEPGSIFVEIAAFDGETVSNTSFLADLWLARDLYIEPVPGYAAACSQRSPVKRGAMVRIR
jgi:hypothetical protein